MLQIFSNILTFLPAVAFEMHGVFAYGNREDICNKVEKMCHWHQVFEFKSFRNK